jgi:hypothetical protein
MPLNVVICEWILVEPRGLRPDIARRDPGRDGVLPRQRTLSPRDTHLRVTQTRRRGVTRSGPDRIDVTPSKRYPMTSMSDDTRQRLGLGDPRGDLLFRRELSHQVPLGVHLDELRVEVGGDPLGELGDRVDAGWWVV